MEASSQLHQQPTLRSGERGPGTHLTGGWVSYRAGREEVESRKIPSPRLESKSRTPIVQPVGNIYLQ